MGLGSAGGFAPPKGVLNDASNPAQVSDLSEGLTDDLLELFVQ
jgi:hypothetical protein